VSENPYSTPLTSPELVSEPDPFFQVVLASRWARLWASLIDGIILIALMFVVALPLAFLDLDVETLESSPYSSLYSDSSTNLLSELIELLLGITAYLAINGYFMVKSGQTIGKKTLGIQVVTYRTHQLLSPGKILGMRFALTSLLGYFPIFGLIDALFIFSAEKRCVHDHMAGSIVIIRNPSL